MKNQGRAITVLIHWDGALDSRSFRVPLWLLRVAIAAAGFGGLFGHGLGHGLGLQVHEAPSLRPNSDAVLQAGMVVTVEPGVYLPGWGGVRIEDDVLVTAEGCEVLTTVAKELRDMILDF